MVSKVKLTCSTGTCENNITDLYTALWISRFKIRFAVVRQKGRQRRHGLEQVSIVRLRLFVNKLAVFHPPICGN